jgi:hypothetical protein
VALERALERFRERKRVTHPPKEEAAKREAPSFVAGLRGRRRKQNIEKKGVVSHAMTLLCVLL